MHVLVIGNQGDLSKTVIYRLIQKGYRVSWVGPPLQLATNVYGKFHYASRGQTPWRYVDFKSVDSVLYLAGPGPATHITDVELRQYHDDEQALFWHISNAKIKKTIFVSAVHNPRVQELPFVKLKLATEARLKAAGLASIIFRVPWLYGPQDDFLARLWRWIKNRKQHFLPKELAHSRLQLCQDKQLAQAMLQAIDRPLPVQRVYEAATTVPATLQEIVEQLSRMLSLTPKKFFHLDEKLAFALRGPLKRVGLIPVRSPMWALLKGELTCTTIAFERDFDIDLITPTEALIAFVREQGQPKMGFVEPRPLFV